MTLITRDDALDLMRNVCELLEREEIPHLIYGSLGYWLLTGDNVPIHDVDVMVRQSDFGRLCSALGELNPGFTIFPAPFTIHANSKIYEGPDGRPFDVSFDSVEHYHAYLDLQLAIDKARSVCGLRVSAANEMAKAYELGVSSISTKRPDYERKLRWLRALR